MARQSRGEKAERVGWEGAGVGYAGTRTVSVFYVEASSSESESLWMGNVACFFLAFFVTGGLTVTEDSSWALSTSENHAHLCSSEDLKRALN